jgi:hypothetical protein
LSATAAATRSNVSARSTPFALNVISTGGSFRGVLRLLPGGKPLGGYYSFVEDFKRDRVSTTKTREAHFGNGWVRNAGGTWQPSTKARFTTDANPVTNICAKLDGSRFVLATGRGVAAGDVQLKQTMERPASDAKPPADLPAEK